MGARRTKKEAARRGIRVSAGDPRYPALVRGFNLRWVGHPRHVTVCRDALQVLRAVQDALDDDLRITVRSGGHCYEDFAVGNDGGVIIDLSSMTGVHHEEATGLYCVEAGATLWDVYLRLYKEHGVTLPGGSCYSIGVGGHVLGAGYGFLSRRDGVTVDYLHAVELVHVTSARKAEVITLRRDSPDPVERELFWGHLGGGGGNFGIVTRFWFKDPPRAPSEAHRVSLGWDWRDLTRRDLARLVRVFGSFMERNSGVDSPYKGMLASLGLTHNSAPQVTMNAHYVGDQPELLAEFAALLDQAMPRRGASRRTIEIRRMPWLFAVQNANDSGPNRCAKHKSAYMKKPFPDGQLDVLWDFLTTPRYRNRTASLAVNAYGCQVNAVDEAATAYPHRSSIMKLQYHTYWEDPAEEQVHLRWIREFYQAMYGERGPYPDETFDGCFVNYPDVDLRDWQTLYYKGNYPRLQEVKRQLDPLDVFHHKQSIELP
ncbi:FAD-binding oxidoreductase [Polyangium sp. 15x6]|uniref:FAD-binding oxidoreductase n=1 Tax=Polyangium sp. 15x6 TaxID=3042687 RepID=UPI00249AC660|nr:FAD-binding oxidoreductase [Polyangium sp. 15x6]MDI3291144.1 FAD-binding oxidoreductase [Polyangium sp. 15x6]